METRSRFISQERMGAWVIVALGTAVLALVTAIWGLRESRVSALVVQTQFLNLEERVKTLEAQKAGTAAAMPAPAAQ